MRIICIHQGYELYGSDRCFVESVAALRAAYPAARIDVVLPRSGPIVTLFQHLPVNLIYADLWVLRKRNIFRLLTIGALRLPLAVWRAWRRMAAGDLIYINTSVIADHMIAARFSRVRTVLHVHEIPQGATLRVLRALALWSRAALIFNSRATEATFAVPGNVESHVVYNGIAGPAADPQPPLYDGSRPLRVLMLGRIGRIKGQEVLLEALAGLAPALRHRLEVRIVGSAFENPQAEHDLVALRDRLGLADSVAIEPFNPDPAPLYRWSDIVVVPSRLPESLGRVAIEAMAHGRPPVASAIGGLAEVVDDGVTGWLVPPGDAAALADRLTRIVEQPAAWRSFPAAGRRRYEALFGQAGVARALAAAVAGPDRVAA